MAIPAIIGGAQALGGLFQSIFGGGRAKRAERQLEDMVNKYQKSQSIMDFYNKALSRYNQNPYQSAAYQAATQGANRAMATGLASAQDRRSGLAALPGLVQGVSDANLRAAAMAEQQQAQQLGQLGQATMMKDREDKYKFENLYNLKAMKAGAGAQMQNAGLQNLFGGLGTVADYFMMKDSDGGSKKNKVA